MYSEHLFSLCRWLVFRKDGGLTWFGWIALALGLVFAGAICSALGGCVNAYTRFPATDKKIERIYQSTGEAYSLSIIVMFPQLMSDNPGSRGLRVENIVSIPIGCIGLCDTACEAAVDTICLPFDWPVSEYRKKNKDRK